MIEQNEYIERRNNILRKMDDQSMLILFAGQGRKRSGDANYPFSVNRNFYYLTGIEQENSVLVIIKAEGENHSYLYIDPKDEKVEKWLGIKLSPEEANKISGIKNILLRNSFLGKIDLAIKDITQFGGISKLYLDLEKELKIDECKSTMEFKNEMMGKYPSLVIEDINDKMFELRMVKSKAEVNMIKEAIKTTEVGLNNVLKELAVGRYEYNMRNVFEFNVFEDRNAKLAFDSIVAGGKNATILHYPDASDVLHNGDLILLDVGAAKDLYCGDISRTYPINGKFSALQRKIYQIVLDCNKQTSKFMKPGITLKEAQAFAKNFLAEECVAQGLITSKEEIDRVYYHGVSHHLGLDTHDGPISTKDMPLRPGNVVTCEPGLYFKEYGIGIRIEDDVLITEDGSEVLSKDIIKEIDDIERILISK